MRAALVRAGLISQALPMGGHPPADAKAAIVTPSRHYPLGTTMPLPRRLALLDWANRRGAWIVEDDYDSEFRYTGAPLPALMSLGASRTIYVGSFSKLLSPALRLGYMVLPPALLGLVSTAVSQTGPRASLVPQPALAAFMDSGAFATHLRRMRRIYADRQVALRTALLRDLPDHLVTQPDPSGMHLVCWPGPALSLTDTQVTTQAATIGLTLRPLSAYWPDSTGPQGLVLGYAAFAPDAMNTAVRQLALLLQPGSAPVST